MIELLSVMYFAGLVMFSAAIGSYTGIAEYAFMIIGGGVVCYAVIVGLFIMRKS
jgi:hypothetical protein